MKNKKQQALELIHVDGFSAFTLTNDRMSVTVIPSLGGKIISLQSRQTGVEWLWRNEALPYRPACYGDNYVRAHDTGGIDECVPTVDTCRLPTSAGIWGGSLLPDHGEIFSQSWQLINAVVDEQGTAILHLEVQGEALPYRFQRMMRLPAGDADLELEYRVDNKSSHPMPFFWCMHPIINILPGMTLHLPAGQKMRTAWSSDVAPTIRHECFEWPVTKFGYDMSKVPGEGVPAFAAKIFTDAKLQAERAGEPVQVGLERPDSGEKLTFAFLPEEVPHLALWLNYNAWHGAGKTPYFNLGFEPTNSNTDSLAEQMKAGDETVMVAPNDAKLWRLTLNLAIGEPAK
ncbi:hypothetical protein R50072_33360 [Simiduia litorea]|uniref:aldose epimerase family protein n=1 Tax=Simiduia litorea TaxID=1435348 RepID=UPI0036F314D2